MSMNKAKEVEGLRDDGWRMAYDYPTQDQTRLYMSTVQAKYNLTTNKVWKDKLKVVHSLSDIFPKDDGSLGTWPTIETVPDLTDAQVQSPNYKSLFYNWSKAKDEEAKQNEHVLIKGTNITSLIKTTMSEGMKQKILSEPAGRKAMITLEDPLTLINLIMTTDFTVNTLNAKSDGEKYFNARDYFDTSVMQKSGESSRLFAVRFKAEFSKVKLLADNAKIGSQLPDEEMLCLEFLGKLSNRYDDLRSLYDKGVKVKPKTVDLLLVDSAYYDYQIPIVKKSLLTESQTITLATQSQSSNDKYKGKKFGGVKRPSNLNNTNFRCNKHRTNEHAAKDDACRALDRKTSLDFVAKATLSKMKKA